MNPTRHEDILVIIPARGGSKGIPHKNIKDFMGEPLIIRSIRAARAVAPDDHIIVSTDDESIARVARSTGLPVPYMRPAHLATDTSTSQDAILDAMDWADSQGIKYSRVVLLQPTSPLRTVDDINRCIDRYTPDIDMAVTVKAAAANPYYNCYEADSATGYLRVAKGDGLYTRRQDCPPAWEMNGAVYVINPESLRGGPMGKFARRVAVEMEAERSVDLDTPLDWIVAETIARQLNL